MNGKKTFMACASTLRFKYLVSFQQLSNPLTTIDIDADSAIGTCSSIITDDRSSYRISDDEEVSEHVYVQKQIIFVGSSKNFSLMPAVHICTIVRAFLWLRT